MLLQPGLGGNLGLLKIEAIELLSKGFEVRACLSHVGRRVLIHPEGFRSLNAHTKPVVRVLSAVMWGAAQSSQGSRRGFARPLDNSAGHKEQIWV